MRLLKHDKNRWVLKGELTSNGCWSTESQTSSSEKISFGRLVDN